MINGLFQLITCTKAQTERGYVLAWHVSTRRNRRWRDIKRENIVAFREQERDPPALSYTSRSGLGLSLSLTF
jgi:hypothetical protein